VKGNDEVSDGVTTTDLFTGLHGCPQDVFVEERGKVASTQQSIKVLANSAFGLFDGHICFPSIALP
jgi:hypothetical protein